jgi:urease accessory protein
MTHPLALPAGLQRVDARGELDVGLAGRTRIVRLLQDGAAKIRFPRTENDPLQAVLINTAGGLTGGDRLAWRICVGAGASAIVTTQACEKVYRSSGGTATVSCAIAVGAGGRVAWLPQETILFEGSALARTIDADLGEGATGLFVEATVFGRKAMGEAVTRASFRDRWRIRRSGQLVHGEDFHVAGDADRLLRAPAIAGGAIAMATLLYLGDDAERHLDAARALAGDAGGASAWSVAGSGKLLARLVAEDDYHLRKRLVPMIELLNGQAGTPKVWSL